eukprot:CAMPEP_0118896946 /NCGR_PEP_ID=MMETSP1166-20130328/4563_1 /TAXON_ID=1104430 /ORGANISM="Chrysoreinhardia sp, Strain CCMP3193" /LENGTH=115 /DNA_ID=CAMNT_0006836007 /DNA_START=41 /DNA_END=388 /DNA_ORIENTATION=+
MDPARVQTFQWAMAHAHSMIEYFPVSFRFALNGEVYDCEKGPQAAHLHSSSIASLVRDILRTALRGEPCDLQKYDCPLAEPFSQNKEAIDALIVAIHSLTGRKPYLEAGTQLIIT